MSNLKDISKQEKLRRPKGRTMIWIIACLFERIPRIQSTKKAGYYSVNEIAKQSGLAFETVKKYLELVFEINRWSQDFDIVKTKNSFRVRPKSRAGPIPADVIKIVTEGEKHNEQ